MNATQYIDDFFPSELFPLNKKAVANLMDAFSLFAIAEFKLAQFDPIRKELVSQLSEIDDRSVLGLSIKSLLYNIDSKHPDEITYAVKALQEFIWNQPKISLQKLGQAYYFLRDLKLNPYEHNTSVHSPAIGNGEQPVQQLSEATQR